MGAVTQSGDTSLHWAAQEGKTEVLRLLMDAKVRALR